MLVNAGIAGISFSGTLSQVLHVKIAVLEKSYFTVSHEMQICQLLFVIVECHGFQFV